MTDFLQRLFYIAGTTNQAEIARRLGVPKTTVANWVARGVSKKGAFTISQVYGVSVEYILTGQDEVIANCDTAIKQQTPPQTTNDKSAFKAMPLFDIDDGVAYAICADNHEIVERAKESATFIPSDSRAFGVRVAYEIDGITPVPIHAGDIVIVEPCLIPKDGDLVLLCLGYPDKKRGMFARLYVNIHNEFMVQTINHNPEPMPLGSVICGVVQKVERVLLSDRQIDNSYQPISTLVKSAD